MAKGDTKTLVDIEGVIYEAIRVFGPDAQGIERVIIKYVGLYIFAYRLPGSQVWELETAESSRAPDDQEAILAEYVKQSGTLDTTTVDVKPPGADG